MLAHSEGHPLRLNVQHKVDLCFFALEKRGFTNIRDPFEHRSKPLPGRMSSVAMIAADDHVTAWLSIGELIVQRTKSWLANEITATVLNQRVNFQIRINRRAPPQVRTEGTVEPDERVRDNYPDQPLPITDGSNGEDACSLVDPWFPGYFIQDNGRYV